MYLFESDDGVVYLIDGAKLYRVEGDVLVPIKEK